MSAFDAVRRAALACLLAALCAGAARAETRIFVISSADGYGVDQCLADGRPCGQAIAAAWCRTRAYAQVLDFGRIDPSETTGTVPGATKVSGCQGRSCADLIAITCTR